MNFRHEIRNDKGEVVASRLFRHSFTDAAMLWFRHHAVRRGFNRRVNDPTITGHYYVNENGETLTLHDVKTEKPKI
jgi:hypothetical protein